MSKAIPVAIGLGLGAIALIILARKVEAAPPKEKVPTVSEIMAARNMSELDAYYELISELYITGVIDDDTYAVLYQAYFDRWYELQGE